MNLNFKTSFALNLGMVIAISMVLYIAFFVSLTCVTHHGKEVGMPGLKGKDMNACIKKLRELNFEISIDSNYEVGVPPLTVLKQIPDSGAVVKSGRTVFLTVSKLLPPLVPMPNLVSLSYRSAEMLLKNNKLTVGDTIMKPDIAAGAVLAQLYKGNPIKPGEMLAMGSKVTLVVGNGMGNTQFDVPEVIRITVDEAVTRLYAYNIQPHLIVKGSADIGDTSSAYVVCQFPKARNEQGTPNRINMGDYIELVIVQNPTEDDYDNCNKPDNTTTPTPVNQPQ